MVVNTLIMFTPTESRGGEADNFLLKVDTPQYIDRNDKNRVCNSERNEKSNVRCDLRERQEVNFCQNLETFLYYNLLFASIFDYIYHILKIKYTQKYLNKYYEKSSNQIHQEYTKKYNILYYNTFMIHI